VTLLGVAMRYLRGRRVATILTALSVALGVALVVASALLARGIEKAFVEGTTDYSLIVGAKGNATQLVLSIVFRLDTATPNILGAVYDRLAADPRVEVAVPVALGDAYQGFRYVATSPAYFAAFPWRRKSFTIVQGRFFRNDAVQDPSYEVVLGADTARRAGLKLGDRFYEGEEMAEFPLKVVGILAPTRSADDRAIFLSLPSFWGMNEVARKMQVKPLTAVLVRPRRMSDLPALHRQLNLSQETQAVFPSAILLGIFNLLGLAQEVMLVVLAIVAIVVTLYLFVSMYSATRERRREIATMRALGAPRSTILVLVLLESGVVALAGGCVGLLLGHAIAYGGAQLVAARAGVVADPFALGVLQPVIVAGVVLLGVLAGLIPALGAYRMDIDENPAPLS
jgi:putative ABC transport system permease protein